LRITRGPVQRERTAREREYKIPGYERHTEHAERIGPARKQRRSSQGAEKSSTRKKWPSASRKAIQKISPRRPSGGRSRIRAMEKKNQSLGTDRVLHRAHSPPKQRSRLKKGKGGGLLGLH